MATDHSYIKLIVTTPDGTRSESTIKKPDVTDKMFQAAYELLHTMGTGELCPRKVSKKAVDSLNPRPKKATKK